MLNQVTIRKMLISIILSFSLLCTNSFSHSAFAAEIIEDLNSNKKESRIFGATQYTDIYTYDYLSNCLTYKAAGASTQYTNKYEYDYAGRVVKEYDAIQRSGEN